MVEAASFQRAERVIVNAFGARSELRAEPHLRRESGSRPELAGRGQNDKPNGLSAAAAQPRATFEPVEQLQRARARSDEGRARAAARG